MEGGYEGNCSKAGAMREAHFPHLFEAGAGFHMLVHHMEALSLGSFDLLSLITCVSVWVLIVAWSP